MSLNLSISWNSDQIRQRGEWITEHVLKLWKSIGDPPVIISYTGRVPSKLTVLGEQCEVSTWRDMVITAMEYAIEFVPDFEQFAYNIQTTYLAKEERDCSKQLSNGWWLYISLSADSVMNLCTQVFEQIGLTDSDWEIELLED